MPDRLPRARTMRARRSRDWGGAPTDGANPALPSDDMAQTAAVMAARASAAAPLNGDASPHASVRAAVSDRMLALCLVRCSGWAS